MGLSVGSASRLAPAAGWVPPLCLPSAPVQGFVPFFPLFPVCNKHDSCQGTPLGLTLSTLTHL